MQVGEGSALKSSGIFGNKDKQAVVPASRSAEWMSYVEAQKDNVKDFLSKLSANVVMQGPTFSGIGMFFFYLLPTNQKFLVLLNLPMIST